MPGADHLAHQVGAGHVAPSLPAARQCITMGRRPTSADAPQGDARRRARALAAPTRQLLLDLLGAADAPRTAQDLADELEVHPTAVRQHMAVLLDAGLAEQVTLPAVGRGRPRVAYLAAGEPDPYRWLASALAIGAGEGLTPRETGRRIGTDRAADGVDDLASALLAEAQRIGFRPVLQRDGRVVDIVLDECPFADVAAVNPHVVCDLHRGIAEGIAEAVDPTVTVELHPAPPHTAGCHLTARRPAGR